MTAACCLLPTACCLLSLASPPAAWKPFSSPAGHFTVLLPGVPLEQKQSVKTSIGTVELILFILEVKKAQGSYVVGYSELPEPAVQVGTEEKRLDNARDGAVASAKGKLKSEKRIALQGHHGRDLLIEVDGKHVIRTRFYAVKNRLYQVLAVGPADWVAARESSKFLDSFKLTK